MGFRSESKTSSTSRECPRPAGRSVGRIESLKQDASVVANLREAGAVIMGKTVTTPYAWIDPPITRNPWNLDRTPGGSSSGSAAAVACGMCFGAIGSQTGGSITRPASFCGVAGMKPTHGLFSNVRGLAAGTEPRPRRPDRSHSRRPPACCSHAIQSLIEARNEDDRAIASIKTDRSALGRLRGFFDRRASRDRDAVRIRRSDPTPRRGRSDRVELDDPVDFEQDPRRSSPIVMAAEAAATHSAWLDAEPDDYPPQITRTDRSKAGAYSALDYLNARNRAGREPGRRSWPCSHSGEIDALITPATLGTAPDTSTTGDPAFNSPWSYTDLPTVSFPIGLAADGLPAGAPAHRAAFHGLRSACDVAQWCEQAIRSSRQ